MLTAWPAPEAYSSIPTPITMAPTARQTPHITRSTNTRATLAASTVPHHDECGWFRMAQLADRIRQGEAGRSWLGAIVFGGGLAGIAGLLVYLALLVAATDSAILAMPESDYMSGAQVARQSAFKTLLPLATDFIDP